MATPLANTPAGSTAQAPAGSNQTQPCQNRFPRFKKAALLLAVLVACVVGYVASQPNQFRVTRSATISGPPADVFAQVNDFHHWNAWSPWAKKDPAAKNSFEGPSSGEGAMFSWSGNHEVGEGRMTLTESSPNERVQIRLDFEKPFKSTSTAEFTFKPVGDQTVVTWSMFGERNFICKACSVVMNMDEMIGGEFEKGLASMNKIVQTASRETAGPSGGEADEGQK